MLEAKTTEQKDYIRNILHDCVVNDDGVVIGIETITFDEMQKVVEYLQSATPQKELFEKCWVAYNRKGSKKKALEYWKKLTDKEKSCVMPHVKAYVSSRELQYQKDFERYLRDKTFMTVVYKGNQLLFDPTKKNDSGVTSEVYMPICDGMLSWNEYYKCFMYVGNFDGSIADGYDDNNRPNGATITLNNGRGTITWDANTKTWDKV